MGLPAFIAKQSKQPSGFFGRQIMTRIMDRANAQMNSFTLSKLDVKPGETILEIGFGSGRLIKQIAENTHAEKISGVDMSADMVEVANKLNQSYLHQGRVELQQANLEALPYQDNTFDKICTLNTLYFWPDPVFNAKEVFRVLRPNGTFALSFRVKAQMEKIPVTRHGFTLYEASEVTHLLRDAGFRKIEMHHQPQSHLDSYCAIGHKI